MTTPDTHSETTTDLYETRVSCEMLTLHSLCVFQFGIVKHRYLNIIFGIQITNKQFGE